MIPFAPLPILPPTLLLPLTCDPATCRHPGEPLPSTDRISNAINIVFWERLDTFASLLPRQLLDYFEHNPVNDLVRRSVAAIRKLDGNGKFGGEGLERYKLYWLMNCLLEEYQGHQGLTRMMRERFNFCFQTICFQTIISSLLEEFEQGEGETGWMDGQ